MDIIRKNLKKYELAIFFMMTFCLVGQCGEFYMFFQKIFNNGYTYFQEHSSYFVVQIILGLIVLLFVISDMIRKPLITMQKDAGKFI
ncbi:hypothetical protein ACFIJ5_09720 [Haloimpatiens sp. FM7330]|uniref:hypothetical protein n=1 Tax=Haloimpatiens sp. FM7330 TaxID=3298610 RepID=UPI00362F02D9